MTALCLSPRPELEQRSRAGHTPLAGCPEAHCDLGPSAGSPLPRFLPPAQEPHDHLAFPRGDLSPPPSTRYQVVIEVLAEAMLEILLTEQTSRCGTREAATC
jgi:hypothetical protein